MIVVPEFSIAAKCRIGKRVILIEHLKMFIFSFCLYSRSVNGYYNSGNIDREVNKFISLASYKQERATRIDISHSLPHFPLGHINSVGSCREKSNLRFVILPPLYSGLYQPYPRRESNLRSSTIWLSALVCYNLGKYTRPTILNIVANFILTIFLSI